MSPNLLIKADVEAIVRSCWDKVLGGLDSFDSVQGGQEATGGQAELARFAPPDQS